MLDPKEIKELVNNIYHALSGRSGDHIADELAAELKHNKGKSLVISGINDVEIPRAWEYYLSTSQWRDVFNTPVDTWMTNIVETLKQKIGVSVEHSIDDLLDQYRSFDGDETKKD